MRDKPGIVLLSPDNCPKVSRRLKSSSNNHQHRVQSSSLSSSSLSSLFSSIVSSTVSCPLLFLTAILLALPVLISTSDSSVTLLDEVDLDPADQTLPRYTVRSYPEFPASSLLYPNQSPHHQGRHRRHHKGHHRSRRQFHFGNHVNVSLGYGGMSQAESGPWGPWSDLSECTRSCGGGVHYQTRVCLERSAPNICVGPSKRYFSCNVHDCSDGSQDFRANQCSRFDSLPFEGQYHNWVPYHKGRNPCELNCMPRGARFYVRQARKVIDGTRCYNNETTDICVDGVCVEVGCDRILGSGIREDKCRECGGNGTKCRTVEGLYDQNQGLQAGYNDILLIPAGATNIEIREVRPSINYIAIRNLDGKFHLNGAWKINPPSTIDFSGTRFYYSRPRPAKGGGARQQQQQVGTNQPEMLKALGPTNETLFVVLLHQEPNQGIAYEYSIPFSVHRPQGPVSGAPIASAAPTVGSSPVGSIQGGSKYSWIFGDYSACSRTCGTGSQRRNVFCAAVNPTTGKQEQIQEALCDPTVRPADIRPCVNENPCPATWYQGEWSLCSCVHKLQHRAVFCTSGDVSGSAESCPILPVENCAELGPKPIELKRCVPEKCPVWISSTWTECDSNCGLGLHNRTVQCGFPGSKRKGKALSVDPQEPAEAPPKPEPLIQKEEAPKPEPEPESDSGSLIQKRETSESVTELQTISPTTTLNPLGAVDPAAPPEVPVETVEGDQEPAGTKGTQDELEKPKESEEDIYVDDSQCDPDTRPLEVDQCFKLPCDETGSVEWITTSWSSCDQDCGSQISTRKVVCSTKSGQIFSDDICLKIHDIKPVDSQECPEKYTCSKSLWFTSEWSGCSASCGSGSKTRHVFCGHLDEATGKVVIPDEDESKCSKDIKPQSVAVCAEEPCTGLWLAGPLDPCTVPCGGGQAKRPLFCMKETEGSLESQIPENCTQEPGFSKSEACNIESCDEDQIATIITCKDTEFGCCPTDSSTPADEDYRNCPIPNLNVTVGSGTSSSCKEALYGCCLGTPDSQALGHFGLGCPINCNNTRFGCCPDGFTVANETDLVGCPVDEVLTTTTTAAPTTTTTMGPLANLVGSAVQSNCSQGEDVEGSGDSDCISEQVTAGTIDCAKTRFGCCPDGWTEATGPNGDGCDTDGSGDDGVNIITSTLSSLLNTIFNTVTGGVEDTTGTEVTPTAPSVQSGSGDDEDCAASQFGCCPNGKKKAIGERYYGCTCEDYPFGCCQDRFSPASGDNYEGCLCERMLYGCCPDNVKPAVGPNQEGCNCESSTYGCCSDMVSFALGPNFYGCPCDTLVFGCCPGNSTIPAKGPNFAGCTCADTPFGCCADGVTVAYGPKFEGCPSGPSLDLKLASEVCSLPHEVGTCRNFSVKWYFDRSYGTCSRFWYGGCEGNGNRFPSQELCERACIKPEGPERCSLPQIPGPCNATQIAWYFDGQARRCDRFQYGGCLGNTNRFESLDQCEEHCVRQEKALDACEQPVRPGPCRGNYNRWAYRKEDGRCREFLYGGCQGNLNNFQSESECQNQCARQSPFEICQMAKAEGPCLGNFPRWHFDSRQGLCREFVYSGCEGNKNRFVDRESCEQMCNQTRPHLPVPTQPDAHANEINVLPTYEQVCALPKAAGPCRAHIIQWFFNPVSHRCEKFYYGGCEGNANRFNDRESCEARCLGPYYGPDSGQNQDPCLDGPKDEGMCLVRTEYSERWYFSVEERSCHRMYYSGCGGNRNNFYNFDECYARCVRPREPVTSSTTEATSVVTGQFKVEWCVKQYEAGPCHKNDIRWWYDRRDGVCKEFVYGGCGGNENRFESQYECTTSCWNSQDICKLAPARGSCSANFTQWYFEPLSNQCYEFQFSGCHGNANRFSSKETCEAQCRSDSPPYQPSPTVAHRVPDYCRLPRVQGPCRGYYQNWYYSLEENQCTTFVYGGCGGNMNRFATLEACSQACKPSTAEEEEPKESDNREVVCRLPMESGQCQDTQAKWFYDPASHTCLPFAYTGCKGNKNRFPTYEHCRDYCKDVLSRDLYPQLPHAPQPGIPQPPPYGQQPSYPEQPQTPPPYIPPPPPPQPQQPPPQQPVDCEPVECNEDQCLLGIDYFQDSRGCPSCRCTNPCYNFQCPEDETCALELFRDEAGIPRGHAECRLRIKPGTCSSPEEVLAASASGAPNGTNCIAQCRTDADCRAQDKCCHNGCALVCSSPYGSQQPPPQPEINVHDRHRPEDSYYYNVSQERQPQPEPQPQPPQQPQPPPDFGYKTDPNRKPDDETDDDYDEPIFEPLNPGSYPDEPEEPIGEVTLRNDTSPIPEVEVKEGDDAVLDCHVAQEQTDSSDRLTAEDNSGSGSSTPTVIWSRDGQQIGTTVEPGRFEFLGNGSLVLRRTTTGDHGVYTCVATSATGHEETGYVKLLVKAPVKILPGPKNVIAQIGLTSYLQCNAIGYPNPYVTWYKGNGTRLPLNSIKYRQLHNFTLLIRKVAGKDAGVYTCNAFNGIGAAALWDVTLLLDSKPQAEPEIVPYDPYGQRNSNSSVTYVQHRPTHYLDRIGVEIELSPTEYRVGSTLQLRCLVRSQITGEIVNPSLLSSVTWFVNSDIPLSIDASNGHRYRMLDGNNSTLVVYHMTKVDSGDYRCRASTGPYADATASVHVQVENIFVPSDCQDNPQFSSCEMIVRANYCSNPTYSKFCCRSCYIANQRSY